ncbi:MAG TPA: hemerythrin domain-containing protein [Wenzhouxiangella sp.]|nr:hemerythrin domain-containing protein [Wenzhouxiangella sp.]
MRTETPGAVLEREHREIDSGIEAYIAASAAEGQQRESLVQALDSLSRHIYIEEEFLFPALYEAGLGPPVFVMLREHGELWHAMGAIEALLGDGGEPEAISAACRGLLGLLGQHNSKEESIIYPSAETVLSREASAELSRLIVAGRIPPDWVCRAVRSR